MGVDGNMSTFTIGYAVMYDETAESFQWVFSHFIDAYGKGACESVHMVMGDEDHGQNAGFERVQQVLHSSVSFLFSCLCVCLCLCVCVFFVYMCMCTWLGPGVCCYLPLLLLGSRTCSAPNGSSPFHALK